MGNAKGTVKLLLLGATMAGAGLLAPPVQADAKGSGSDIPALMKEKRCVLCHSETGRLVGPPYKMIAHMYKDRDHGKSMDKLVKKILKGGMGTWGAMPMPASDNVTEEQARAMARWILNLE